MSTTRDGGAAGGRRFSLPGAVLCLTSLAASALLIQHEPLRLLGGLADEWFMLGVNLARYATLGWGNTPIVLRPPGYPFFIASVLRLGFGDTTQLTPERLFVAERLVYVAQCLLLAVTTALLYAWLRKRVSVPIAFAGAFAFGVNPYTLLLTTLLHYDVLHLFFVVVATAALERTLAKEIRPSWALGGCGALWGVATLVRPTTLLLPVFVLLVLLARAWPAWRRAVRPLLVFGLGFALAIAPWTARNYVVTGRLLPTNAQGWTVLWGSTLAPLKLDPNRYQWRDLLWNSPQHVYERVTGEPGYSYSGFLRHNIELEAAYRSAAIDNIRRAPGLYLRNVARSLATLHLQINSALVSTFERIQTPGVRVSQDWFWGESSPYREATAASRVVDGLFALLTLLALGGAVASVVRRDRFALVPGAVWACLALAQALVFMDFMYYYIKLPFLAIFATLGLAYLDKTPRRLEHGSRRLTPAGVLAGLIVAWCSLGVVTLL